MTTGNDSLVTKFILIGLTDQPELQLPLFVLFLVNYTATVIGNLSLMSLICLNSHLHTPMYFFIFNLACIDFCYSCVFTPKMLLSFVSEKNSISFTGCMTQLFFFSLFVNSECYVLTAMAYDRYVAICQPLMSMVVMSRRTCSLLMLTSHLMSFATATVHIGCIIRLNFGDSNIINHFMFDTFPLLELSCGDTHVNEFVSSFSVAVVVLVSSLIILSSYTLILINIIHLSSAKGFSKAMSTCSSHITVALFYGFGLLAHVKPSSAVSVVQRKFFSIVYTFVLPLLNPLIYSLRNKDVKLAVRRTLKRHNLSEILGFPWCSSPAAWCLPLLD